MTEYINNSQKQKEIIKDVLRQLGEGRPVSSVKDEFDSLLRLSGAAEIAQIEQELINEGMPVEEIQRLCDVHVAVFRTALDAADNPEAVSGHPIETFIMENRVLNQLLDDMASTVVTYTLNPNKRFRSYLYNQTQQLLQFDRHYLRKENLLFPFLEKKGFEGPSKVMWGIHNEIRSRLKAFNEFLTKPESPSPAQLAADFQVISDSMKDMIYKEEHILFPNSMQRLDQSEWHTIQDGEKDYGYFMVTPLPMENTPLADEIPANEKPVLPLTEGKLPLDTGALTLEQINIMLNTLPVDVTFVDENDTVCYFSRSLERIFARSSAIVGRKVQNCHPPHSVGRVQRILDDFRSGQRNTAEFWIQMNGKFIHIRYFAMHDAAGNYRGALEVSQDITGIRALQGERRLLDEVE